MITAAGADFSLGRDRQEGLGKLTPYEAFRLITELNTVLAAFPGIVLSVVQGRAFGFAVGLILRSDLALAADDARFALDEGQAGHPADVHHGRDSRASGAQGRRRHRAVEPRVRRRRGARDRPGVARGGRRRTACRRRRAGSPS
ncbi:MAG: enoyl-CoA hydratase-related protein [Pseudomonadota bacterium]